MMNILLVLTGCLCIAAAALEIRCMTRKAIPDNELSMAGRRIKVAGYLFLTIRIIDVLWSGGPASVAGLLALCLVAFGDCIRCSNRLHLPDALLGKETAQ